MRQGLWRSSRARRLENAHVPEARGIAAPWQNQHAPLLARQGPTDTETTPSASESAPTPTSSDPPTSTSTPPPEPTSTTSTTTTPSAPPTISTTPTLPTSQPTVPTMPLPGSTTTIVRTVTSGGISPTASAPGDNDTSGGSGGFWSNKAAVGGVFGAVGLIGAIILFLFITNAMRRSRARQFDREVTAAAATGPGGYRDEDDEQPTFPFQNKPQDNYDMQEFNGSYGHPYAAPGVVAGGAAAGYYNDHNSQGGYDQYAPTHPSYAYSDSASSYPSTYYTGQQPQYSGAQAPYPAVGQSSSPPPREFMSPPPPHMAPMSAAYSAGPSNEAYGGMAGMGAYGSTGTQRPQGPMSAYGGAERGAYAHMQRQDQLNRAVSTRSAAPTYASQHPSSGHHHDAGMAGLAAAAGLGGAAAASSSNHGYPRDEKVPLPPMPPTPPPVTAPRLSGEHDAGNKSEGELPNPFRGRASGESLSEEWDDEESAGHNAPRVLKVANQ